MTSTRTPSISLQYLPWLIQYPCHRWYFSKHTVSSYFPTCLELPWSLYRPPRLWPLSTPMSLEIPWDPVALRFLVSLCRLCLHVVLWILENRESPQCLPAKVGAITTRSVCWKLLIAVQVQRKQRFDVILIQCSTVVVERINSSNFPLNPRSYFQEIVIPTPNGQDKNDELTMFGFGFPLLLLFVA